MRHLYSSVVSLRDRAWTMTSELDALGSAQPNRWSEMAWYQQGRTEAFAEVMTLIEQQGGDVGPLVNLVARADEIA